MSIIKISILLRKRRFILWMIRILHGSISQAFDDGQQRVNGSGISQELIDFR